MSVTVSGVGGGTNSPINLPPGKERLSDKERAGLAFERMLVVQLTQQLAKTAQPDGEESSAATSAYRDLLPGTLADAVIAGGGLGLAKHLFQEPGK